MEPETNIMRKSERGGFALPVAVFALVIIGILVTNGFFIARQEGRIGIATRNAGFALYLAEQGMDDAIANWSPSTVAALPDWGSVTSTRTYGTLGEVQVEITKMTNRIYFVDATSTITEGGAVLSGATHRVGQVVRVMNVAIDPPAALTTRGPTTVKGTAEVHGADAIPPGWGPVCTGPLEDKPGIMSDDSSQVGTIGGGTIDGSPDVDEDPTITDSTFTQFGDLDWEELTQLATLHVGSGTINQLEPDSTMSGDCLNGEAYPLNWGNPENPGAACSDYFPIIHADGSLRVQSGGVGQGILLIDGDLDLRGNFTFYGIIIVQGNLGTQGNGNKIFGGVLASNADFDSQSVTGGSVVTNSTCSVTQALVNSFALAMPRPLESRSWVDLTALESNE